MKYRKCPKCKGTMIVVKDGTVFYRCSQCSYEAKTKVEIDQLEHYNKST